jgi:hypothetical protein
MSFPRPERTYSQEGQDRLVRALDEAESLNRKKGQDIEAAGAERIILSSPDGSRWALAADNAGNLTLAPA